MTEEGVTGAFIRDLKGNTRTVCFVSGSGEHQIDDTERNGLSHFKELLSKDNYEAKTVRPAAKGGGSSRLHQSWSSRDRPATTSNPKSTRSRNTSRVAGARC